MNIKETSQNNSGNNVVETMALYLNGGLNKNSLSSEDQQLLSFYMGVYLDDEKFKATIDRRIKLLDAREFTTSLSTENDEVSKAKNDIVGERDPLDKVMRLGMELNSRFYRTNRIILEEINYKKNTLRKEIGLPTVKGKDWRVKNKFYKFLVKRICNWDGFGIFNENDRTLVERDEKLNMKINQVKGLVDELLNDKTITWRGKYRRFGQFSEEYKRKWGELT